MFNFLPTLEKEMMTAKKIDSLFESFRKDMIKIAKSKSSKKSKTKSAKTIADKKYKHYCYSCGSLCFIDKKITKFDTDNGLPIYNIYATCPNAKKFNFFHLHTKNFCIDGPAKYSSHIYF